MIHTGDCLDVMPTLDAESIDAIVTDPPYGLGFMGKAWDSPGAFVERKARRAADGFNGVGGNHHPTSSADVGRTRLSENAKAQEWHRQWAEAAYRVARPSSYLLAFGGTRTVHRLTCAIEDAGWVIRDLLVWAYASGFPKSKASLKPAWEPIVMARKPGPLRMLNIDETRIPGANGSGHWSGDDGSDATSRPGYDGGFTAGGQQASGRWPANVLLTDPIFDGDSEGVVGGGRASTGGSILGDKEYADIGYHGNLVNRSRFDSYGDEGTYSRFFLVPKAARSDREPVLGGTLDTGNAEGPMAGRGAPGLKCQLCGRWKVSGNPCACPEPDFEPMAFVRPQRENTHPTVKPLDLMRHLVRLVTPAGGIVLDPFLGSGTTALACEMEGFGWVGIEKEAEYVAIAEARLNGTQRGLGLIG